MKPPPIQVQRDIGFDHPAYEGHFPGAPLLPGAALLSEVLEVILDQPSLASCIGTGITLEGAKFLAPVRPGDVLCIELEAGQQVVHFEVTARERVVARGSFAMQAGP